MTEFYSYITKDGDRWDSISYKFYETVPKDPVIESGIKLKIPVLDTSQTIQFELPPWKK